MARDRRRSRTASAALVALVALASSTVATSAQAFCRRTSVPEATNFQPSPTRCWTQGVPLFWASGCVHYAVFSQASKQVSLAETVRVADAAFLAWTNASCRVGHPSIVAIPSITDDGAVTYVAGSRPNNTNVIRYRDDSWTANDGSNTLGLTTLTFDKDTGEIFDADMEINAFDHMLSIGDPIPSGGYDLESIVTHEAGHFLGLAHSGDTEAVMYSQYRPGSSLRELKADDVQGICAAYPADRTRPTGAGVIPATACALTATSSGGTAPCAPVLVGGCGLAESRNGGFAWLAGTILGLGAIQLRRRRDLRRRFP